jgi:hypothetical protein
VANDDDRVRAAGPRADLAGGNVGREGEGERLSPGVADVLIHRLFAVGLDLHSALTCIEVGIGGDVTAERIQRAINGLDGAIRDFRGVVFDLRPEDASAGPGLRSLIVEAVDRACAPSGARPAITLGHGLETVADQAVWLRVATFVHEALTLVPGDHLADAHVVVGTDPVPPERLFMHIEAPARDLAGVAGRLRSLETRGVESVDGDRMDVRYQDLPRSPERSRIRLEWPMAAS